MKMIKSVAISAAVLAMAGCASNGTNNNTNQNTQVASAVGKIALQTAVDAKCRTAIQKQKQWALISRVMSAEQRAGWEAKICSCASREAVNTTTVTDMALIINPSTREAAAANIAQRTISTCVQRLSK